MLVIGKARTETVSEFLKGLKIFLTLTVLGVLNVVAMLFLPEMVALIAQLLLGLISGAVYFIQLGDAFGLIEAERFLPYL